MPTCSAYALEAFQEWGFFAGLGLTIWRVLRCNPFCKGGYDPVPERKKKSKKNKGGEKVSDEEADVSS